MYVKPGITEKHLQALETPGSYGPNTGGVQSVALLTSPVLALEFGAGGTESAPPL
jgi:hypothetical protein